MLKSSSFFILIFLAFQPLFSQEIKLKGGFVENQMSVGQEVHFWMKLESPASLEVEFPDSTSNFTPFEFVSKSYIPTSLAGNVAIDSVTYTLQSFEIDKIQQLKLPVKIRKGEGSTEIFTELASISLMELAPQASDTTKLQTNVSYNQVKTEFNYPLLYIILGAISLLLIILALIFGKRIVRWFKIRKFKKRKQLFDTQLQTLISQLKAKPEIHIAEKALKIWKDYQEKLDGISYSKLTTKEILNYKNTKELEKPLASIDRLIYGRKENYYVHQDFEQIVIFAEHQFNNKIEEIKNG